MEIFLTDVTLGHRNQVPALHLCFMNTGPGLASKLFVMSQMLLVGRLLKSDFGELRENKKINKNTFSNVCERSLLVLTGHYVALEKN